MKRIILSLTVLALLALSSCNCRCSAKYSISSDGHVYYTNMIEEQGGCIVFTQIDGTKMKLCGTYTVTVNKDWKPKRQGE